MEACFSPKEIKVKTIMIVLTLAEIQYINLQYTTQSNTLLSDIKEYSDKIDQQSKEKDAFFACMSHEIRNPIQSLMGALELLVSMLETQSTAKKLIDVCKSGCEVLLNMVSNILDISKIQAGKMELSVQPADPRETVMKVLRLSMQKAEGKRIGLLFSDCPDLPPALEFDPHKLCQVVSNLTSNAIKFTQKGNVRVKLSWKPLPESYYAKTDCLYAQDGQEEFSAPDTSHNFLTNQYRSDYIGSSKQ